MQQFLPLAAPRLAPGVPGGPAADASDASGTPVANNQSAIFYPETWLHYVIRPISCPRLGDAHVFHYAGSTIYAFPHHRSASGCATVGGVTFMLCGSWLDNVPDRALDRAVAAHAARFRAPVRRGRPVCSPTALGTGMALLAGHLHIAIYVLAGFAPT